MKRLTLKAINKELERLGYPERLYKGYEYYYFGEGNSSNWCESSVYVYHLNQLTLQEWIGKRNEYEELYQKRKA